MTVIEMPVDSLRETDFIKEMVRQMRALDSYGQFDGQPAERLLDPFVLTKERKAAIPLIGDPDETTVATGDRACPDRRGRLRRLFAARRCRRLALGDC